MGVRAVSGLGVVCSVYGFMIEWYQSYTELVVRRRIE